MDKQIVEIDSMLEELIPDYLANRTSEIEELKVLYGKGDLVALGKIAHKIAGNSGSYGFHDMGKMAKEIENLCSAGKSDGVAQLLNEIESYLQRIEVKFI